MSGTAARISRAVVRACAAGWAGLSNWRGMNDLGVRAAIASASATAPAIPVCAGVSTSSAPYARKIVRRSMLMLSGITRMQGYARTAAIIASEMPVLPLVASMSTLPGPSVPSASAA